MPPLSLMLFLFHLVEFSGSSSESHFICGHCSFVVRVNKKSWNFLGTELPTISLTLSFYVSIKQSN